jgi:integrase
MGPPIPRTQDWRFAATCVNLWLPNTSEHAESSVVMRECCDGSHNNYVMAHIAFGSPLPERVLHMTCHSSTTQSGLGTKRTLKDVINRYESEIAPESPLLMEAARGLHAIERTCSFAGEPLEHMTAESISAWRDERLECTAMSGAVRELDLLTAIIEIARTEWRWLDYNPALAVERPRQVAGKRARRVSDPEIEVMCDALGLDAHAMVGTASGYTALAFVLSIETGMRKNEMQSLRWSEVFLEKGYLSVLDSTGETGRTVPLSTRAAHLFDQLFRFDDDERCIPLRENDAGRVWSRAQKLAAGKLPSVADLQFNDSRHEATARMARKFDLLPLSRILDNRNLASLVTYYLEASD